MPDSRWPLLFTICSVLLASQSLIASEIDSFSRRYEPFRDETTTLNQEMKVRLSAAVQKANDASICDKERLFDELHEQLQRIFYGKFEGWINSNPEIDTKRIALSQSIYRHFSLFSNLPVRLGTMGFGAILKVNGHIVGTDKFGHFFDEGLTEYERITEEDGSIQAAIQYGLDTEEKYFGKPATGVKSYGDMVANFNGAHFWSDVIGEGPLFSGKPYFRCEGTRWVQVREFDWSDYIDAGWDEAINCSDFRTGLQAELVDQEIIRLEQTQHQRFTCPVSPELCPTLEEKYGEQALTLINPKCRAYFKNPKLRGRGKRQAEPRESWDSNPFTN